MNIVYLTPDLYEQFEGSRPPATVKGLALVDQGAVLGILCQSTIEGQHYIMCGLKEGADRRKIIEGWRMFLSTLDTGRQYFALEDKELSSASGFLKHFGFEPFDGDMWIYRG